MTGLREPLEAAASAGPRRPGKGYLALKRIVDAAAAGIALVVLSPLMLVVAMAVRGKLGRPLFFRQVRPGLGEKPFTLYKFRTMTNERGPDGRLLPDHLRLGRLGRFLRSWSLDELPQLWNVLVGDMSLVGPRPLPVRYLTRYTPRQRLRHCVKPGITGWAQVNGRNSLDWEARFQRDLWYVGHASLWLDLRILLLTLAKVALRSGVRPGVGTDEEEYWGPAGPPRHGPKAYPVEENEYQTLALRGQR